jgi:hypothetical protein
MSDAEWLTARDALAKLKDKSDEATRQLIACASLPNVRTRAALWMRDGQTVQENVSLRNQFWEAVAKDGAQDWKLGVFEHSSASQSGHFEHRELLNWKAVGVEFYWPDIVVQLGLEDGAATTDTPPTPSNLLRGQLPATAKPNNRRYEEAAHAAAEIVRAHNVNRAEAIRKVAEKYYTTMWEEESVHSAIRRAFDLMYHSDGMPIKN